MDIIESLKEQLALAHEQLGTQAAKIEALEQALKVAGISIDAPKNNVSSEGDFWAGLEESLNQEEALKEQGK